MILLLHNSGPSTWTVKAGYNMLIILKMTFLEGYSYFIKLIFVLTGSIPQMFTFKTFFRYHLQPRKRDPG